MKRSIQQLTCRLLALALVLGLTGCGSMKLDQTPGQTPSSAPETSSYDAGTSDFDVSTAEDSNRDFSKYEAPSVPEVSASSGEAGTSNANAASSSASAGTQTAPDTNSGKAAAPDTNAASDNNAAPDTKPDTLTCYLSISCAQILNNMEQLEDGKESLVPSNGVIYSRHAVQFQPGETVFDVLKRVTKENRIHMESRFTPAYESAYICGIGNLYEFDCGPESGWMYCVNGWYPNYGVSKYQLNDQDVVQFNYTCDLGRDLGGSWQG